MIFTHNWKDPITQDVGKNYFFHGNTVHSFILVVPKCRESMSFEKIWNFIRAHCTIWLTIWYHNIFLKFIWCDMINRILTPRALFSFHMTWHHSNKAVQEAVPLIVTHPNDKAYILIRSNEKYVLGNVLKM